MKLNKIKSKIDRFFEQVSPEEVIEGFENYGYTFVKNETMSKKMEEFLDKVDALCYEYGFEIHPTVEGWTGKTDENGKYNTIAIIGNGEAVEVVFIDGDGRGK